MKTLKDTRVVRFFAYLKNYLGMGQEYVSNLKYPVAASGLLKLYFPDWGLWEMGICITIGMICLLILGWLDGNWIRLLPTSKEIETREFNDYFKDLENSVKRKV